MNGSREEGRREWKKKRVKRRWGRERGGKRRRGAKKKGGEAKQERKGGHKLHRRLFRVCSACIAWKATKPQNDECRERIRTIIERTLTGKARMNAHKDRIVETRQSE